MSRLSKSTWPASGSDVQNIYKLLDGSGRFVKGCTLVVREADLDDLLDAILAQFHRDADEQIADAVLAFEENSARQDLLLVLEDRLAHLDRTEARGVKCRTGFQKADDLGTAI